MTCPRCYWEFAKGPSACPQCGVKLVRALSGVMKTSAVMIASGNEPEFFSSVQDVPEPLRTQLIEITNGRNSDTIVIADQAGKEQITQLMARRELSRERNEPVRETPPSSWSRVHWLAWSGAAAVLLAGGAIAVVFMTR